MGSYPDGVSWVGALDMGGNVFEWVADRFGSDYYGSLEYDVWDPTGPEIGNWRVLRGGKWNSRNLVYFRAANRVSGQPQYTDYVPGFRCARPADS